MAQASYFERFSLVEVQQTFYQPPRLAILERWRRDAPAPFEFTLKAWQLITHEPSSPTYRRLRQPVAPEAHGRYGSFRPSAEVRAAWNATLDCARALAAQILVFQCPPSFAPTAEHIANLRRFFRMARREAGQLRLFWEPRGGWPRDLVGSLCRELGLHLVVDPFQQAPPEQELRYFRLHGIGGYRYRYSDDDLVRLRRWSSGTTCCLFNHMDMAEDAMRFQALAARR